MSCLALPGESLLSRKTTKRLFSFREKERAQDKAGAGARHAKASQGIAMQTKTRAIQAVSVSCIALPGETLLAMNTINRLFSFREK